MHQTRIYHLVPRQVWEQAQHSEFYFPAHFEQDGFIHAAGDKTLLVAIANHFYTGNNDDWLCLEIDVQKIQSHGIEVRFEAPAAVGDVAPSVPGIDRATLFPHIYGGLPISAVSDIADMHRDASGEFIALGFD